MNPILGYFIFINLGDGCLGSKYGNTHNTQLLAECCTRVSASDPTDDFIGEYDVVWLDAVNPLEHTPARLKIVRKAGSVSQYKLTWHRTNSHDILYYGEGMLCAAGLVGSYCNAPIQNLLP